TAELGRERVGTLRVLGSHRLEASSVLAPVLDGPAPVKPRKARGRAAPPLPGRAPLRVLQEPVPLDAPLRKGALLSVERRLYSIDALGFERRVDEIEWWLRPVARDYLRLWLSSPEGCLEALVYVDRHTGKRFLHALAG
ncbi:MAG: hypothetical protein OZ921_21110, partial [Sorangiineae bacterium]|nr:hypothetical protein [Sorangiineae bacterium]